MVRGGCYCIIVIKHLGEVLVHARKLEVSLEGHFSLCELRDIWRLGREQCLMKVNDLTKGNTVSTWSLAQVGFTATLTSCHALLVQQLTYPGARMIKQALPAL
jgi:hypothetical protein